MSGGCARCGRPTCDGCPLCCCEHPGHTVLWEPQGCSDCNARIFERGRTLASEREDLITQGVDPSELLIPLAPTTPISPVPGGES